MPYALCPMPYARYSGSPESEVCPMPYALCPMPYALCRIVPQVTEKGYKLFFHLFYSSQISF
jgi:hypothetical protein